EDINQYIPYSRCPVQLGAPKHLLSQLLQGGSVVKLSVDSWAFFKVLVAQDGLGIPQRHGFGIDLLVSLNLRESIVAAGSLKKGIVSMTLATGVVGLSSPKVRLQINHRLAVGGEPCDC